jgi:hypothetical protein
MRGCYGQIYRHFADRASISFGWGTNLTSALLLRTWPDLLLAQAGRD